MSNIDLRNDSSLINATWVGPFYWSIPELKFKIQIDLTYLYVKWGLDRDKPHVILEILRPNKEIQVLHLKSVGIRWTISKQLDIIVAYFDVNFVIVDMSILTQVEILNFHSIEILNYGVHMDIFELGYQGQVEWHAQTGAMQVVDYALDLIIRKAWEYYYDSCQNRNNVRFHHFIGLKLYLII